MIATWIIEGLRNVQEEILAAWLEDVERLGDSDSAAAQIPIELYSRSMGSLYSLVLSSMENKDDRRALDYMETLIGKGFLKEVPVSVLVGILQALQNRLIDRVRDLCRAKGEPEAPSTREARTHLDDLAVAACRFYEKRSERFLDSMDEVFERASIVSFFLDSHGRIHKVNKVGAEILDVNPSKVIGQNLAHFVNPAELAEYTKIFGFVSQGDPQICEMTVSFAPAKEIVLSASFTPVYEEGRMIGVRFIARDITEEKNLQERLRRSEEKYRKLIENANDASFLIQIEDGTIVDANIQALELTGYRKRHLLGLNITELFVDENQQVAIDFIQRTIFEGAIKVDNLSIKDREGKAIPTEISSNVIEYGDTRVIQATLRDMTGSRKLEQTLQERTAQLEQTQKEMARVQQQLIALERSVHSERLLYPLQGQVNPQIARARGQLSAIKADVNCMRSDFDRVAAKVFRQDQGAEQGLSNLMELTEKNIETCESEITETIGILEQLISIMEQDKRREIVSLNVEHVMDSLLQLVASGLPREVLVRKEYGGAPPIRVDKVVLTKVLYLSLRSSIDAVGERGRLSIRTFAADSNVAVEFRDTGRAITPTEVREILGNRPFHRWTRPLSRPDLQLCRSLLSRTGGSMALESGHGMGNVVKIELPLDAADFADRLTLEHGHMDLMPVPRSQGK